MNLHLLDYGIILSYVFIILGIGFMFARKKLSDEDYLLAGRQLTLPAFVITLVTTWYGAILGVGEFVFGYGVVGWVTQGLFWYVVYIIFALFVAPRIQKSHLTTIADQFRKNAGQKSALLSAILTYIMTSPAPYILSLAIVISAITPLDLFYSTLLGAGLSALYIWFGGFKAVIRTDIIQFILMFAGFGMLLGMSVYTFGGAFFITENLPASHLTWNGTLDFQTIVVWGLIAFWTFVDPNFYQRCYAAKDRGTVKRGILLATLFWFAFDMLTLITGLYARAAFPDSDPLFAYITLSDAVLPFIAKGLFVVTILSIIMSTIDSFLFSGSTIISVDILKRKFKHLDLTKLSRIGIVITVLFSLVLIGVFQSIIGIIYAVGTVGVGSMLIPLLVVLFSKRKVNDAVLLVAMMIPLVVSSSWLADGWIAQEYGWPVYRFGIEPMYVGFLVSAITIVSMKFKLFEEHHNS